MAQSTKWDHVEEVWVCFEKCVLLTGRVQVNESIKEREHSKISMRKQFTKHTVPHEEITDQ